MWRASFTRVNRSPDRPPIAKSRPQLKRMVAVVWRKSWTWTAVEWPSGCWPSCWPSARWSRWASTTTVCRPAAASGAVVGRTTGHSRSRPRCCRPSNGHSGPRTIPRPTTSRRPVPGSGRARSRNTGPRRCRPPWTGTRVPFWDWPTPPLTRRRSSRDSSSR